jgi:hypothetical protein
MQIRNVEIYSDLTNAAVMRHPDRRLPGVLIQGDSLYSLCVQADDACAAAKSRLDAEAYGEVNELRNALWSYLNHYKSVLGEHQIPLPFNESTGA